jgi:hypothetical protein
MCGALIGNALRRACCAPVCEFVLHSHDDSPLHFDGTISTSMPCDANTSIDVRRRVIDTEHRTCRPRVRRGAATHDEWASGAVCIEHPMTLPHFIFSFAALCKLRIPKNPIRDSL